MRVNRICRVPANDKKVWGSCWRGVSLFLFLVSLGSVSYGVEFEYAEACIHRLRAQVPGDDSLRCGWVRPFDLRLAIR